LEILILERLKVLRTVSKYSVAGSEPNTVLVAKSDTLGGAWSGRPQHHRPRANTWQWRGAVGWGRAFCGSRRIVKVSPGEPGATVDGVRSGPRRAPSGVLKCRWITKPCPRRTSHGCARLAACLSFCGRALRVRSTSAKAAQHGNKPMDRQCTVLCGHSSPAINSLAA